MVANLILLCSLKTCHSFKIWKLLLENRGYLIHHFFQASILSTQSFIYLGRLSIFSQLFFNNFCTASYIFFYNKTFKDSDKNFERLFRGYSIENMFGVLP
jgi:hypothetical protein